MHHRTLGDVGAVEADREAVADVYDEFVREHVHQRW